MSRIPSGKIDFESERANFWVKRGDFGSERVDLGPLALIAGRKVQDYSLRGLEGG